MGTSHKRHGSNSNQPLQPILYTPIFVNASRNLLRADRTAKAQGPRRSNFHLFPAHQDWRQTPRRLVAGSRFRFEAADMGKSDERAGGRKSANAAVNFRYP